MIYEALSKFTSKFLFGGGREFTVSVIRINYYFIIFTLKIFNI